MEYYILVICRISYLAISIKKSIITLNYEIPKLSSLRARNGEAI